jgi:hypothetical protein
MITEVATREQFRERRDVVLALRNSGICPADIARTTGISKGTVAGIIYRAKDQSRNTKGGGIFTSGEKATIARMAALGKRVVDTAIALGRTAKSVSRTAKYMGVKFNPVRKPKKPVTYRVAKRFAFEGPKVVQRSVYIDHGLFDEEIPGMTGLSDRTGCAWPCFHNGKQQMFCNATCGELQSYCPRHSAARMKS